MLTVTQDTAVSRERLREVIADGWTYSQWVVGNSRMRAVDPHWPVPGSAIHHSVGVWPAVLNDETVVESCLPYEELVLRAKGRPLGSARIVLKLSDTPSGSRVEMIEVPIGGVLNLLPDQLAMALTYPRNRECLSRLAAIAERRVTPE